MAWFVVPTVFKKEVTRNLAVPLGRASRVSTRVMQRTKSVAHGGHEIVRHMHDPFTLEMAAMPSLSSQSVAASQSLARGLPIVASKACSVNGNRSSRVDLE